MVGRDSGFLQEFPPWVDKAVQKAGKTTGERFLGNDPNSGRPVYVRIGRFGTMAQIGDAKDDEKPIFASMQRGQHLETITLEEALELFKLPLNLGSYEGEDVIVAAGRFGAYIKFGTINASIPKGENPLEIKLERAIELIRNKKEGKASSNTAIKVFEDEDIRILNGRYGAYISHAKKNYKIPKDIIPADITLEQAKEIVAGKTVRTTTQNQTIRHKA